MMMPLLLDTAMVAIFTMRLHTSKSGQTKKVVIVNLKAKCPMQKDRAYNIIQWSTTHHHPKLISLTNDPRMTQVDLRMTHRE